MNPASERAKMAPKDGRIDRSPISPAVNTPDFRRQTMSFIQKLCCLSLTVPLVAASLLLVACGEDKEGPSGASGATAEATVIGAGDTTGVTDTEIKLGIHIPLSQNAAAAYAPLAYGMKAFFDYINEQGGVYGRAINLVVSDDHYNPPDTVEVVRRMVEQDKVFAIVGGLGESPHSAVWKYLEEKGVPDMFISSGLTKWTDPVVKSRFGGNPDYVTEGTVLGRYIAENYDGKKLGMLLQNDEFGAEGEKGLLRGLEGSNVEIVARETDEPTDVDVTAQTQRLRNAGAEVIAAWTHPIQAASLVKSARDTLDWDVPIIVTGVDCSDIFISLAGAQNAEGVVSVVFGHQAYESDLPGVQKYQKIWEKFGSGESFSNFALYGMSVAEATVWVLEMAGPDLTRGSFLDAAESMCDVRCTTCLDAGPYSTSPTDHRLNEVEQINIVKGGKWVAVGDTISFESTTDCTPATPPPGFEDQPAVGADAEYVP